MQIKTKGIVIKAKNVGDDRLIHILTDELGVITVFAKGAQKPKGKWTSTTELFCYCKFSLFQYRDNYSLDSVDCEDSFFELRNSLETLSLASYIADIANELAPTGQPSQEYLSLVLNALYMLKLNKKPHALIKAVTELRMISMAGFMPNLLACSECGEFLKEKMYFSLHQATLCCSDCKVENLGFEEISHSVLASMRHIIYSEPKRIFSFEILGNSQKDLAKLSEAYMIYKIERHFKSLKFYHSIANM